MRRGPAPKIADARDQKIAEQQRELGRLRARVEFAEALVEVQKAQAGAIAQGAAAEAA